MNYDDHVIVRSVDIVPEPFDTASPLRINSAIGMPSIFDKAFNPYRVLRKGES